MALLLAFTLLLFARNIVLVHLLILQAINHYYGEACHNIIILQCYSLMPIHNGIVICMISPSTQMWSMFPICLMIPVQSG